MPKRQAFKAFPVLTRLRGVDFTNRFVILGLFLLLLATLTVVDPTAANPLPRCPFLSLTGLRCPGCGSLRAVRAILEGDFLQALRFNALAVALLPAVLLALIYSALWNRDALAELRSGWLGWLLAGGIILWWILRNVLGW
jgi:hypothetical protein